MIILNIANLLTHKEGEEDSPYWHTCEYQIHNYAHVGPTINASWFVYPSKRHSIFKNFIINPRSVRYTENDNNNRSMFSACEFNTFTRVYCSLLYDMIRLGLEWKIWKQYNIYSDDIYQNDLVKFLTDDHTTNRCYICCRKFFAQDSWWCTYW